MMPTQPDTSRLFSCTAHPQHHRSLQATIRFDDSCIQCDPRSFGSGLVIELGRAELPVTDDR